MTSISKMFTADLKKKLRATITQLLLGREQFFAERVDGIFRSLSGDHVTNSPSGFNRRMILNYMFSYGSVNHSQAGYINDLRAVIAKFMGRDEPSWWLTSRCLDKIPKNGKWHPLDGGSVRIRLYKKGTAHLEVHTDMAWRLNSILASMYPAAIPAQFRTKPKTKPKDYQLINKPLPFVILAVLSDIRRHSKNTNTIYFQPGEDSPARKQAAEVMKSIGATQVSSYQFEFDYDAWSVINEIIVTGCIPDHKSHQFYHTPEPLARRVIELADIGDDHFCLEPSAGQGGLADLLPKDRAMCVEISPLNCKVLESKGFDVHCGDFLTWTSACYSYDRVVLNPPFSGGRWQGHLAAAGLRVKDGGRLVAILPASAKSKELLPGFECEFHGPYHDEFADTSVSVVILVADRVG